MKKSTALATLLCAAFFLLPFGGIEGGLLAQNYPDSYRERKTSEADMLIIVISRLWINLIKFANY